MSSIDPSSFTTISFTRLSFTTPPGDSAPDTIAEGPGVGIRLEFPTGPVEGGGRITHRHTARRPLGYTIETILKLKHRGERVDIGPNFTSHFMTR